MASGNGSFRDSATDLTRSIVENSIICFWMSDTTSLLELQQRNRPARMERILRGQPPSELHPSQNLSQRVVSAFKHLEQESQSIVGNGAYYPIVPLIPVVDCRRHLGISVGKNELGPRAISRRCKLLGGQLSHSRYVNLKRENDRRPSALPNRAKCGAAGNFKGIGKVEAQPKVFVRTALCEQRVLNTILLP